MAAQEGAIVIHYFCGKCGTPFLAVYNRTDRVLRAEPQCLARHPLCIQIGTEEEARLKREAYLAEDSK